jgi:hypothetical protein
MSMADGGAEERGPADHVLAACVALALLAAVLPLQMFAQYGQIIQDAQRSVSSELELGLLKNAVVALAGVLSVAAWPLAAGLALVFYFWASRSTPRAVFFLATASTVLLLLIAAGGTVATDFQLQVHQALRAR